MIEPDGEGELLEVAMGPHHPSTHGVFRMDVALDGERVVRLKPVFGYLHRNHEKIAEGQSYLASMPYTDRLDYICPLTNNWAYALAVEKLAGQEVPERAEYLRVILGELTRFQNHASSIGFSDSGDGRQRHAADVCLPRAGEDSGPVRGADRRAHDGATTCALAAAAWMPRRRGWTQTRKVVAGLPAVCGRV